MRIRPNQGLTLGSLAAAATSTPVAFAGPPSQSSDLIPRSGNTSRLGLKSGHTCRLHAVQALEIVRFRHDDVERAAQATQTADTERHLLHGTPSQGFSRRLLRIGRKMLEKTFHGTRRARGLSGDGATAFR